MRRSGSWLKPAALAVLLTLAQTGARQAPPAAPRDDELRLHLQNLQRRVDDPTLDMSLRERVALEMAATLDRAAQTAATADARRLHWTEAVAVLDRFRAAHPGAPMARASEVQAAVYLWARARSWVDPGRAAVTDAAARDRAVDDLNASVDRLKAAVTAAGFGNDVYAQNARFRLAQALADLADVGPDDAATRRLRNDEALDALSKPISEPSLKGYAGLLRATLLNRVGRYDAAEAELQGLAKSGLPESDVLDARVAALSGRDRFDEARKAVDAARVDEPTRLTARARLALQQRRSLSPGAGRDAAEAALFRDLKALRDRKDARAAVVLAEAAAVVREPAEGQGPEAWDMLAEGAMARGESDRGGRLIARAADRAEALGRKKEAADYRLKAGAALFRAGKFAEADPLLTRVAEDPAAGDLRPRAGLLRALSRGRALAVGQPGGTQASYKAALKDQVDRFPDDPTAAEARWLLGKLRLAESDRGAALKLWAAIPHGRPRWLDAQLEMADLRRTDLDVQRLNNDPRLVAARLEEARGSLAEQLTQARGEVERNALQLARAELELTPVVGKPEAARDAVDSVLKSAATPDQRDAALRLQVVALAQLSRYLEAEQAARRLLTEAGDPTRFLDTVRRLDRCASESESDLKSRRMGLLMGILLRPLAETAASAASPPAVKAQVRMREVRARLFSGENLGARQALTGWSASPLSTDPGLLRDVADTYARLDAFELAVDVDRLRTKLLPAGSLPWLDARYRLALAYFRSNRPKDAMHLIDATAILHPDLGGGELKEKFIKLRRRIEPAG